MISISNWWRLSFIFGNLAAGFAYSADWIKCIVQLKAVFKLNIFNNFYESMATI